MNEIDIRKATLSSIVDLNKKGDAEPYLHHLDKIALEYANAFLL